jgi:hypothetical protein
MRLLQAMDKLENLRRVELRVRGARLNHLRTLSLYCSRLEYVAFQLTDTHVPRNFTISLPHIESLVLLLANPDQQSPGLVYEPWNLPKLNHFGVQTEDSSQYQGFIQQILYSAKEHIASLDLVGCERETSSMDLVCSFPNLETLYLDPSNFRPLLEDPGDVSSSRFPLASLHTLGWRVDEELKRDWKWIEELVFDQFNQQRFPNLTTLLCLENLESRVRAVGTDVQ